MNYYKIYNNIISNRLINPYHGYTEVHHIMPRSLGGTNTSENLVHLSAKEHFICHLLLTKIYSNTPDYFKILKAFLMMLVSSNNQKRFITSKTYAILKQQYATLQSESMSGKGNHQYGTMWISNPATGETKKHAKEVTLPNGWVIGRYKKYCNCKNCGNAYLNKRYKTETCSKECEKQLKSKLKEDYWRCAPSGEGS